MFAVCRNLWYASLDSILISRPRKFNTRKSHENEKPAISNPSGLNKISVDRGKAF